MDNTTLIAILTCSGMWAVINTVTAYIISKKQKAEDKATISKNEYNLLKKALLLLTYDTLERKCTAILQAGTISVDSLAELRNQYEVYRELGGNGVIQKMMDDINKLPIKKGE